MRPLLALALLGATAFAAPVPKELKTPSPWERLQGKWVIVSLDSGSGPQVQTGDFAGFTLVIDGDKVSTATTGGQGYVNVTAVYDFAATPMRMDVTRATPGIIKFENGRLHWCHAQPNQPAPTEFRGSDGGSHCFIWKRAEK